VKTTLQRRLAGLPPSQAHAFAVSHLQKSFVQYDQDKSGELDMREVQQALSSAGW